MTKRVHVIASFNIDGMIRPLWLRLSLDESAPCYRIDSCICTQPQDRFRDCISYRCTATCANHTYEIGLNYHAKSGHWDMIISNSSSMVAKN